MPALSRHFAPSSTLRPRAVTEAEWATEPKATNLTSDGKVLAYLDFTKGKAEAALVMPQLLKDGDPNDERAWFDLLPSPVKLTASCKRVIPIEGGGSKYLRCVCRGVGKDFSDATIEIQFGYRTSME